MIRYRSMKARQLLAILMKEPLNYRVARQKGSHRRLASDGFPSFTFAFHDGDTVGPGVVKKILERDVGLTPSQAADILDS